MIIGYIVLLATLLLLGITYGAPIMVFSAELLEKKDWRGLLFIMLALTVGVLVPTSIMILGASLTRIPFSLIGGVFMLFIGLRIFFTKAKTEDGVKKVFNTRLEAATTAFLVSLPPGSFSISAAQGYLTHDLIKVFIVFLAGPLAVVIGAPLYLHGFKLLKLPIHKVAGLLVIIMATIMMFSK